MIQRLATGAGALGIATLAVALGWMAVPGPGVAQGIDLVVDRVEATLGDQIVMAVTVEGSRKAEPQLPPLEHFDVYPRGQSSQVQIVNGRVSSSVIYNYILLPHAAGSFTIGAASVEIDGEVYRSRPFQIRVVKAAEGTAESRDLFVTATVSERNPYVGQQVVYTWRLYRRVRIGSAQLTPPEYDGFLVEQLGEAREYEQVVQGQSYLVSEIREALFPQEIGTLTVPGRQLSCEVATQARRRSGSMIDDFFGRVQTETKILRTRDVEIEVRPLPSPPAEFSGLIGRFDVTVKPSRAEVAVADSVTLEVTVAGEGNAQMIPEPLYPDFSQFKIYDDQPSSHLESAGASLTGSRTFHKALVAQAAGDFAPGPVTLVYFDPANGSYRTAASAPIELHVTPASGEEDLRLTEVVGPHTGKVAVKILADDILPIHKGLDGLRGGNPDRLAAAWIAMGILLPPLAFMGLFVWQNRRRRLREDVALRRRRNALRRSQPALARVEVAATEGRPGDAADLASRCLREYLGDKLNLEGAALTTAEAERRLGEAGVAADLSSRVHRWLDDLEASQYGAARADSSPGSLSDSLRDLLQELERGFR